MGLEQYSASVHRTVNHAAGSLLARRIEWTPVDTVTVVQPDILRDMGKKHVIGLFGPHKTCYDSTILTLGARTACPERAITFLTRPPDRTVSSGIGQFMAKAKQAANPLLHPVYTMRDTPFRKIDEKNEESFSRLAKHQREISPSVVFLAPDGGTSPGECLDHRFTKARGLLMLVAAYLKEEIPLEQIAIVPIGLRIYGRDARVVVGDDMSGAVAQEYHSSSHAQPWKDSRLNSQVAEGVLHSINVLLA